MPLRDFICSRCGTTQERYYPTPLRPDRPVLRCQVVGCNGTLVIKERSQEGEGHTTHVRIK